MDDRELYIKMYKRNLESFIKDKEKYKKENNERMYKWCLEKEKYYRNAIKVIKNYNPEKDTNNVKE